jgi:hypothetical protein
MPWRTSTVTASARASACDSLIMVRGDGAGRRAHAPESVEQRRKQRRAPELDESPAELSVEFRGDGTDAAYLPGCRNR